METKANENTTKDTQQAAEKAFDMTAPLRTLVETALDEYQVQVDRWLDHGAAQVAEGFRAMKAINAGGTAAVRTSVDSVMSMVTEAQGQGAAFYKQMAAANPFASMFSQSAGRAA